MTVLNFLQNLPLIQWAILLLSASSLVLTLTLAVKNVILPLFSTLTKSQKQSLNDFLRNLSNFSTETFPSLSNALITILSNHELLPISKTELTDNQADSQADNQSDSQADSQILNIINLLKEYNNEKHK